MLDSLKNIAPFKINNLTEKDYSKIVRQWGPLNWRGVGIGKRRVLVIITTERDV